MPQIPKTKKGYKEKIFLIKDFKTDRSERTVEGYFSSFNFLDADRDIIRKGAFARSIENHGPASTSNRKIAHLAHHDIKRMIGEIRILREDDYGLYFLSQLGRHKEGQDALMLYEDGIIKEHSIGFNYLEDGLTYNEGDESKGVPGYWDVTDVKLWEGSYVTFGSNENTPNLSAMKTAKDILTEMEKVDERMEVIERAAENKSYSKQFHEMHVFELKKNRSYYNALVRFALGSHKEQAKAIEAQESRYRKNQILKQFKI